MTDLDWYYQEAKDYTQSIGGQAASAVEEVYGDARDAGGYVIETLGTIAKAPAEGLKKVGDGLKALGEGIGGGADKSGEGIGIAAIVIAAAAAYMVLKK
jgi:hypothetical protein